MPFLKVLTPIQVTLDHNTTATYIRLRTAQLQQVESAGGPVRVLLPNGSVVQGKFNPNYANPNITGPALIRWIKSLTTYQQRRGGGTIQQTPDPEMIRVSFADAEPQPPGEPVRWKTLLRRASRERGERRRRLYERAERDPALRDRVLETWGAACQVVGCATLDHFPEELKRSAVEVHHLNHVSQGGCDDLINLCLLCANHHRLVHVQGSVLERCDNDGAEVRIGDLVIEIERNYQAICTLS